MDLASIISIITLCEYTFTSAHSLVMCFEAEVGGKSSQAGQTALHHIAAPKTLCLIKEPIDVFHSCSVSGLVHLWGMI